MINHARSTLATLALIIGSIALISGGCSGGTTGTGRPATIVTGRILTSSGDPLPDGATVTILETGDAGETLNGSFTISIFEVAPTLSLLIESPTVQSTAIIPDIPDNARTIEVTVRLRDDGGADVTDSDITTDTPPVPTETPKASPSPRPTIVEPTPTVRVTPTTISPTSTPTVKPIEATPSPAPIYTPTRTPTPNGMGVGNTPTATPIPSATV